MSAVEMTRERLAANLRAAIKASGLSQTEVAERASLDPTALSKVLKARRNVTALELALICTATRSDVLGILEAEPLHGPSFRKGVAEAERRVGIVRPDMIDGDYTGCGHRTRPAGPSQEFCDLPIGHGGPHHAHMYWRKEATS